MKPVFLVELLPVQQFIDDLQELLFILAGFQLPDKIALELMCCEQLQH